MVIFPFAQTPSMSCGAPPNEASIERPTSVISESIACSDAVSHNKGLLAASKVSSLKAGRGMLSYRPAGMQSQSTLECNLLWPTDQGVGCWDVPCSN